MADFPLRVYCPGLPAWNQEAGTSLTDEQMASLQALIRRIYHDDRTPLFIDRVLYRILAFREDITHWPGMPAVFLELAITRPPRDLPFAVIMHCWTRSEQSVNANDMRHILGLLVEICDSLDLDFVSIGVSPREEQLFGGSEAFKEFGFQPVSSMSDDAHSLGCTVYRKLIMSALYY